MVIPVFDVCTLFETIWVNNPPDTEASHIQQLHCDQGFVWRPNCVGFFVVGQSGDLTAEIRLNEAVQFAPDVVRALQVPFVVGREGVMVYGGDGGKGSHVAIPEGSYMLIFENGYAIDSKSAAPIDEDMLPMWCRLWFNRQDHVEPEILVQDAGLNPTYPLCMQAEIVS